MATEEERAATYRAEQLARARATLARARALQGDAAARASFSAAWAPRMLSNGPLVQVARGMFVGCDDLDSPGEDELQIPFTEQMV